MAKSSLDSISEQEGLRVQWLAYELRPGGELPPPAYLETIRARFPQTQAMARSYGVDMGALRVGVDTRPAHRAYKIVQRLAPARAAAFNEALYRAHWSGEWDIGEPEVLARLADAVGADGAALQAALAAGEAEAAVVAEERTAYQAGIQGVPAFIFAEKYLVTGVRPPEQLAAIVAEVRRLEGESSA